MEENRILTENGMTYEQRQIEITEKWFGKQIELIKGYPDEKHRLILIFALIDAFAQNYNKYERNGNCTAFVKFLEKYCPDKRIILKSICPVTLFYDYGHKVETDISLRGGRIYFAEDKELQEETLRILSLIPEKREITFLRRRHTYGALIYAMRNKLMHEWVMINSQINYQNDKEKQIPHVVWGEVYDYIENKHYKKWVLHIPEKFIFEVAEEAVRNYVAECRKDNRVPFNNHSMERQCFESWYGADEKNAHIDTDEPIKDELEFEKNRSYR